MPFSHEEMALIDAIHADPSNDVPRLAYADWLDRNGIPDLPEFIQLQCWKPYLTLSNKWEPRVARSTWELRFSEPERSARAIKLLGKLYATERFPKTRFYDLYHRGLPVFERTFDDSHLACGLEELRLTKSPLVRFNVRLDTAKAAEWLAHPIMRFVDDLRVHPALPLQNEKQVACSTEAILAFRGKPQAARLAELKRYGSAVEAG